MTRLRDLSCLSIRNPVAKLSSSEIVEYLDQLPAWSLSSDGGGITREVNFKAFMQAISFINRVAEVAEAEDHHPDFTINYRRVTLSLSTHDSGGLTVKDFIVAAKIDAIVQSEPSH